MDGFLGNSYLWVKALHVIFVIFWMAGMFMLPRFFAYHAEDIGRTSVGSDLDQLWRLREKRLIRIIMTPAMLISWVAGLALALHLGFGGGWLHLKIALVLFMTAAHGIMIGWHKRFTRGENVRTGTFYRIVNEVPTLLIIPVVILVIVQPF